MTLVLFALLGCVLGRWLGMGRRGYVTLAAISVGAAITQMGLLIVTADRSWMTMLPLLIGMTVIVGMLLGALRRRTPPGSSAA